MLTFYSCRCSLYNVTWHARPSLNLLCFQAMKKVVLSGKSSVSSPFKNRLMCHLHALFWRLLMHCISAALGVPACIEEMKTTEIFVNTEHFYKYIRQLKQRDALNKQWTIWLRAWHSIEVCLNWNFLSSICLGLFGDQEISFKVQWSLRHFKTV